MASADKKIKLSGLVPPGSCDTHAHVIATDARYLATERSYTPAPAPEQDYLNMLDRHGMTYGVLVQISVYGTDNRYMCEVLRRHPQRLRGVAVVDWTVTDEELVALNECGVRGIRINALYGGEPLLAHLESLAVRIAAYGWHIQLYLDGSLLQRLGERLVRLPCPVVLDHMAHCTAAEGVQSEGFQYLLTLARHDNIWIKLSAANRLGNPQADQLYTDTTSLAQALVGNGDARLLWGSDWPHVACTPVPDTADLVRLLALWVPDEAARRRILVDNPQRLYGFLKKY